MLQKNGRPGESQHEWRGLVSEMLYAAQARRSREDKWTGKWGSRTGQLLNLRVVRREDISLVNDCLFGLADYAVYPLSNSKIRPMANICQFSYVGIVQGAKTELTVD